MMSSAGAYTLVAGDGERENFHRSARARLPSADTPDTSPAAAKQQLTVSIHYFAGSLPPLPILEQVHDWILAAFQAQTSHADVGTRMVGVFRAAGLPSPSIFAETIVTDGTDSVFCAWITATLQSVLPC